MWVVWWGPLKSLRFVAVPANLLLNVLYPQTHQMFPNSHWHRLAMSAIGPVYAQKQP
jgi:hypothetical protein